MSRPITIEDIEVFEATLDSMYGDMKKKAARLRSMLAGVSTPATTRKGLSREVQAKFVSKRRNNISKKARA